MFEGVVLTFILLIHRLQTSVKHLVLYFVHYHLAGICRTTPYLQSYVHPPHDELSQHLAIAKIKRYVHVKLKNKGSSSS